MSESERTVAVVQEYDIDFVGQSATASYKRAQETGVATTDGYFSVLGLMGGIVEIPEKVYDENGVEYTVTCIADGAINHVFIGFLALPPTIESLNDGIYCIEGLNGIYLPAHLKEISGILECPNLESIQIPWNVEKIKRYSLYNCGMKAIYLPPSVKTLEDYVLSECDSLHAAMMPGLERMGKNCFSGCDSFGRVSLPETLHSMGEGCFNGCKNLKSVTLPSSEIQMDNCFNDCPSIKEIEIHAEDPYPFPYSCFKDADRAKCKLTVPDGSVEKYQQADGWKDFYSINDIPTPGFGEVSLTKDTPDFHATGHKGYMKIMNPYDYPINVVDSEGEKIASINDKGFCEVSLPKGIYIVSSRSHSVKIAVK